MRTNNTNVYGSGGGGKGGGGGGFSEQADTVSSYAIASFVDLIGEGRIKGLVNGERSIYLDGVPLRSTLGTPNYRPFKWSFTPGTQDQGPIPGFAGTQQEVAVGVPLLFSTGKVIRTISDADADAVRVTVSVNGLSQTSSEGKVGVASVSYKISVRQSGGSWVVAFDGTMTEKTGSRFQRSHEVPLGNLGAGPYEVAVERVSADSASVLLVNAIAWDSFTVINYEQFAYPNSALIGVGIDARYFSQIPERKYHVEGLLVRIPSNYNPKTREYTGIWDGNFVTDYTNNPAWCLFDILTHPRYGCGSRISDAMSNKWAFYTIARYCDEPVLTGVDVEDVFGLTQASSFSSSGQPMASVPQRDAPTEPRFTLNVVLNQREDAYKVLNNLASVFRGMIYWSSGQVFLTQDSPAEPTIPWNNANVIGGVFNGEGSSRAQRHTVALVGWNDPKEDFKQKFEYVEDREGIARYGVRPAEIVAFGCTSRGQARRVGLWLLYTEMMEKDAITFSVGLDSAQVRPGMIGEITDNHRIGARWGGRLVSADVNGVELDAPVTLGVGSYTLATVTVAGTLLKKSVTVAVAGTFSRLDVTVPFAVAPKELTVWSLASTTVTPRLVRVVSVKQEGAAQFRITALTHNPSKFPAIESGEKLDKPNYSFLSYTGVPSIQNLVATENSYKVAALGTTSTSLNVSWDQIVDPLVRGYRVKLSAAAGGIQNFPEQSVSTFSVQGLPPDTVTVHVSAINVFGIAGPEATFTLVMTGVDTTKPVNVSGLAVSLARGVAKISWNNINDLSYAGTELHLESSWNSATAPLFKGLADSYNWPSPAVGTYTVLAKHFDSSRNYSDAATSVVVVVSAEDAGDYVVMSLSRDSVSLPADVVGTVSNYSSAHTDVTLDVGGTDDTANWLIVPVFSTGVTGSLISNQVVVTNLAVNTGSVTITASRAGFPDQVKIFTLTKSRSASTSSGAVSNELFDAYAVGGSPPIAQIRFNSDGTVSARNGKWSSFVTVGNWYLPTTAGIGSTHWVRAIPTPGYSGSAPQDNVWTSLGTALTWSGTVTPGDSELSIWDYSVATDSSGSSVVASGGVISISVNDL